MSQAARGPMKHPSGPAPSNIYTVLAAVAFAVLLIGVGFVWYRSSQLFGSGNPFTVMPKVSGSLAWWLPFS